jgi:transcriptional regulator with XRE-family HTH domain
MTDHDDLAQFFAEQKTEDAEPPADDSTGIGARIAEARANAELSHADIAERLGVKESTVAKWESGSKSPRGHHVSKLAGVLGVSMSWILMGRGIEPTNSSEIEQLRSELGSVRARLDDVVNELAVLDQRLGELDEGRASRRRLAQ